MCKFIFYSWALNFWILWWIKVFCQLCTERKDGIGYYILVQVGYNFTIMSWEDLHKSGKHGRSLGWNFTEAGGLVEQSSRSYILFLFLFGLKLWHFLFMGFNFWTPFWKVFCQLCTYSVKWYWLLHFGSSWL